MAICASRKKYLQEATGRYAVSEYWLKRKLTKKNRCLKFLVCNCKQVLNTAQKPRIHHHGRLTFLRERETICKAHSRPLSTDFLDSDTNNVVFF